MPMICIYLSKFRTYQHQLQHRIGPYQTLQGSARNNDCRINLWLNEFKMSDKMKKFSQYLQ